MKFVIIDESGDLGFNFEEGSSKYLIFSFIFCDDGDSDSIRKELMNIRQALVKEKLWAKNLELKFSFNYKRLQRFIKQPILNNMHTNDENIRLRVLASLSNISKYFKVYFSYTNKQQIPEHLRPGKRHIYNKVLVEPLIDFIDTYPVKIILDKNMNKVAEGRLTTYLSSNKKEIYYGDMHTDNRIDLIQSESENEPLIWLADYLSGTMFSKLEHNNLVYYNQIEHFIEKDSIRNIYFSK